MRPLPGCFGITGLGCIRRWPISARCSSSKTGLQISPSKSTHDLGYGIRIPGARSEFYLHLNKLKTEREFILCGDVNIAHQEIDLKNWKGNRKNSGFLPEERAWMTKLLTEAGLVDVYRQ